VHINWLKIAQPPYFLASCPAPVEKQIQTHMPWKDQYIVIATKHPQKGYLAKVIDAIAPATPKSELKLVLQFQHFNASQSPLCTLLWSHIVDAQ
jgi:hypothetical protein